MTGLAFYSLGGAALAASLTKIKRRLELSRAKHGSITGHARLSRRLASFIPYYEYGDSEFFCSDGAPVEIAMRRRGGFMRLAALYRTRFAVTAEQTAEVADSISDLQFTDAYRVPFQYNRFVRHHLRGGSFLKSSAGVTVTDLDGNTFYDLTGSYGVNLFGYDFYKQCLESGARRVAELGPVLGAYHPVIAYNVRRLRGIRASTRCRSICPVPRR